MKRGHILTSGLIALAVLLLSLAPARAQSNTQYFPETQHNVSGLFLQYWQNNGGLAQQGYPLTEEFQEKSDLNGQTYTVQYFERAVFESHPENQAPYNVLLSQLGTFLYKQKYPTGAPNQAASTAPDAMTFSQTGYTVGGKFLTYWQQHGGLAQQGYPISNEFQEKSALNGQTYMVQYFERAVFEMHPENAVPYDVLLSQLGKFQLDSKYPNNSNSAAAPVGTGGIVPNVTVTLPPAANPTNTPAAAQPTNTPVGAQPSRTSTGTDCAPVSDARKSVVVHTGPIEISGIHYIGQEYVELHNTSSSTVDISGYTIRDKNDDGQSYTFPSGSILPADGRVQVFTEPGHPYSFNDSKPIWNNCGDAAQLLDASGQVVATFAYGTHILD